MHEGPPDGPDPPSPAPRIRRETQTSSNERRTPGVPTVAAGTPSKPS